MKLSAGGWQLLRKTSQVISFVLFIVLFIRADANLAGNLFTRLDPLLGISASLAGRALIASFWLGLITVGLTILFGRVWCGWFCPLGSVLDWIKPRKRNKRREKTIPEGWRKIKWLILVLVLVLAFFGNQSLTILDPITITQRATAGAIWPAVQVAVSNAESFLYQFGFLWGVLDPIHEHVILPIFAARQGVFQLALASFIFFAGIVALNWVAERFWCRYLCPLGGLLGFISRFALLRREVDEKACTACNRCTRSCPTGTIEPERNYASDPAECIVCCDCLVDCKAAGSAFRWQLPGWKAAEGYTYDPSRREMLAALGSAALGVALAGVEPITRRDPANLIRPPGAKLVDFESLCIRCGACIRTCPTQGLQASLFEGGVQNLLTPKLVPRLGYCDYNCTACSQICTSGAIPLLSLEEKRTTPIGLARVDTNRCLPWAYQTTCIVCEEACPLPEKAIWLIDEEVEDANGNTVLLRKPQVDRTLCIGCGVCEYQCPMGGEAAIRVFTPTETAVYSY